MYIYIYMGKYVGVIRKAYRTYMCKFGKYWDIGINVLNIIQYGYYVDIYIYK